MFIKSVKYDLSTQIKLGTTIFIKRAKEWLICLNVIKKEQYYKWTIIIIE